MITFYTQEDLISFGQYLLSESRNNSIENKENLDKVHQEDIDNWICSNKSIANLIFEAGTRAKCSYQNAIDMSKRAKQRNETLKGK